MKTGYWLRFIFGFIFLASITLMQQPVLSSMGNDRRIVPSARVAPVDMLPLANPRSLSPVEQAYLDSFSILRYENSCSQFY
ncbi:MAG TPA: hypothetical protein VK475_02005, partial [Pyrinomonadaceae bacterium]|nr:hypothetical protein [Pyrinomonadaceae bacterium]